MLMTLAGEQIPEKTPPVGHSISTASTPTTAQNGSTSPGGASTPLSKPGEAYQRFMVRQRIKDQILKKTTAQDQLVERVMRRLDAIDTYLSDEETWFAKLEDAKLRDIILAEGIMIDKLQLLQGRATQVITTQQQDKLDQVLPALMQALQQRGLHMTATERKLELTT